MANFFDQFDTAAEPPKASPFANAISTIESGGNYKAIGPATRNGDRAFGKYQVMGANIAPWSQEVLGRPVTRQEWLTNPDLQDKVFEAKFGKYVEKYGPEGAAKAWFAGEKGMNNPNAKDVLGTTVQAYGQKFSRALGPTDVSAQSKPAQAGGNFFDQFDGQAEPTEAPQPVTDAPTKITVNPVSDRFVEPPSPQNAPAMQAGLQKRGKELAGTATSPVQRMAIEHGNLLSGASQGATPNVGILSQNMISAEVFQGDDGSVLFRDPQSGQVVPTDNTKHVVMRDPSDNTPKVYARSAETNEGPATGVARALAPGLMAGAPTVRAMAPAIAASKPGQVVAEAAGRLGVEVPRAVTTDNMATQRMAAAARNIPVAGDPLVKGAEKAITQLGTRADEVAAGYGSGNKVQAGDAAKDALTTYIGPTTKARADKLYTKVDEIAGGSTVPLSGTRNEVARILAQRGAAALPDGESVGLVKEALTREGMAYEGIKTLRTRVGELVDSGLLPPGMSQGDLKRIYAGLTKDLEASVRQAGPEAQAAFQRANNYYRLVSERRDALVKIVGKSGDAPPEQVFDRLVAMASSSSRADAGKLMQARKAIGSEDWNEFVSGLVSRMGRDPAAKGAPESLQGADFSPQRFLTAFGKLSPEGRAALFRSGGNSGLANSLDDIATVSSRFKELQKFSNPSGTAQTVMGGIGIASIIAEPITTLTTLAGGRIVAQALSKPATAASVAQWSRSYERLVRTPSTPRLAQFELASRNLANNLRDFGVNVSPTDFIRALQAPSKVAAEDQEPGPRVPGQ